MKILFSILPMLMLLQSTACIKNPLHNQTQNAIGSKGSQGKMSEGTEESKRPLTKFSNHVQILDDTLKVNSRYSDRGLGVKGDIYPRYLQFYDVDTGKKTKKIDLLFEANPFIEQGLSLDFNDGAIVYYALPNGDKTSKHQIKKLLPAYQFDKMPELIGEENCMGAFQPFIHEGSGFTIVSYQFGCIGLGREYIRADYNIIIYIVYDKMGNKVFEYRVEGRPTSDSNNLYNSFSPNGEFVLLVYDRSVNDDQETMTFTDMFHLKTATSIFKDSFTFSSSNATSYWIWGPQITNSKLFAVSNFIDVGKIPGQYSQSVIIDGAKSKIYRFRKPENYRYSWNSNTIVNTNEFFGLVDFIKKDTIKYYFDKMPFIKSPINLNAN